MWEGRWREECACGEGGGGRSVHVGREVEGGGACGKGGGERMCVCGEVEGRGCVNIEVYVEVVSNPDPKGVGTRLMSRRRSCEVGV